MYSPDSSEILFPTSGSRLLSESPILPSSSSAASTGHGGDDLSISELSLSDRQHLFDKPFSLLAPHDSGPSTPTRGEVQHHQDELDESDEDSDNVENAEQEKRHASKAREEKLQSDIFILRKLNASFSMFNEALQDTGSANQRVAAQLQQTDALLNKYIGMLSKSEEVTRLIFDERWFGVEEDEATLEREILRARQEEKEKALAAQQEAERKQHEEQERIDQEESERVERERKEKAVNRGAIRGVRGTRASMRGMRGTARTAPAGVSAGRGRGGSAAVSKLPTASRPSTIATTGTSARGLPRKS